MTHDHKRRLITIAFVWVLIFSFMASINIAGSINTSVDHLQVRTTLPPETGDWLIADTMELENMNLIVNGNLTIEAGGCLILNQVTVIMNCTTDGQYAIVVKSGGKLYAEHSNFTVADTTTIRGPYTPGFYLHGYCYKFKVYGELVLYDCELSYLWGDWFVGTGTPRCGLEIYSDDVIIVNTKIKSAESNLIYINRSSPTIINCELGSTITQVNGTIPEANFTCNFSVSSFRGIYIDGGSPVLINTTIHYCLIYGMFLLDTPTVTIINTTVGSIYSGIVALRSTPVLINCTVSSGDINPSQPYCSNFWIGAECEGEEFDAHLTVINTQFNHTRVTLGTKNSTLTVKWYLNIKVNNPFAKPVVGAEIVVQNVYEDVIYTGYSDAEGEANFIVCTERVQNATTNQTYSPYRITVSKNGRSNFTEVYMTQSQKLMLILPVGVLDTPTFYTIDSPDDDGNYYVNWTPIYGAEYYELEEATNPEFMNATKMIIEAGTSVKIENKTDGIYYYRVKAHCWFANSSWSAPINVTVKLPVIEPFVCDICNATFDTEEELSAHITLMHPPPPLAPPVYENCSLTGPAAFLLVTDRYGHRLGYNETGSYIREIEEGIMVPSPLGYQNFSIENPKGLYYTVFGRITGKYDLLIMRVENRTETCVKAMGIPIVKHAIHLYIIDWDLLRAGEAAVNVSIDMNNDGFFELKFIAHATITGALMKKLDTDGDGMTDIWELNYSLDPIDASDAYWDMDKDGLNNAEEYRLGTDPTLNDTDGDRMNDDWEARYSLNPTDPADAGSDADNDGFTNLQEFLWGTVPTDPLSKPEVEEELPPEEKREKPADYFVYYVLSIVIILIIAIIIGYGYSRSVKARKRAEAEEAARRKRLELLDEVLRKRDMLRKGGESSQLPVRVTRMPVRRRKGR